MKPTSGRAPRVATLAATALACVAFTLGTPCVSLAAPPAVADNTPDADAAIGQHDWARALTELDARIASNPRDVQARFKRATVLARLGRDNEAITAFTELTQLYPELPEPYNNLAALYAKQGRYDDARVALETAVKANPSYGLAYENLGDLYLHLADASYRRAASLGQVGAGTRQRLADLQKIVAPAASAPKAEAPVAAASTTAPLNRSIDNPSIQFGGPTGSLAMPPYMAPSPTH
ncbi:hypothetical protein CY652_09260 [Burkholderia sp. WAC0059]|uniref:tetratricopeptide repeat protein n=1 Tax=Burkholderia sp. WAC0059 TaxID=2066022 RepID=UPI000C7E9083|nr:tetratricopeptide repeat protein [Burkholderia sp. WAC0059]PLZ02710.1 hypothetical protein CY652_09260 [Burkholderia sp. WAC0059]